MACSHFGSCLGGNDTCHLSTSFRPSTDIMLAMKRGAFGVLIALSLVLCVATTCAWVDSIDLIDEGANQRVFWKDMGPGGTTRYMLQTVDGDLWFIRCNAALDRCNAALDPADRRGKSSGSSVLRGIPGVVAHRDFALTNGKSDFGLAGFAFDWVCASGDVPIGAHGIAAIPYWPFFFAFSILPAIACRQYFRIYRGSVLASRNQCRNCSYNLTGNTSGICPECGTKILLESHSRVDANRDRTDCIANRS